MVQTAFVLAVFAIALSGHPDAHAGTWEISGDGRVFSFQSDRADAADIIRGIEEMTGVSLHVRKLPAEPVSVKYINVTLDELMYRMGLEYVLEYTADPDSGAYELSSGWLNYGNQVMVPAGDAPLMRDDDTASPPADSGLNGRLVFDAGVQARLAVPGGTVGGSCLYRAAFPSTPRMDGRITDWPDGIPWQEVTHRNTIGVQAPTNDMDASFAMAGMADATNLYLALAIRDDLKASTNSARIAQLEDDAVRLLLLSPDGRDDMTVTINRHHVYMTDSRAEGGGLHAAPVQYVSYHNGVRAVIRDDEDGWQIEIAVPLDPLGVSPGDARTVGMDVELNDRDAGEPEPSVVAWSAGARIPGNLSQSPFSSPGSLEFIDIR